MRIVVFVIIVYGCMCHCNGKSSRKPHQIIISKRVLIVFVQSCSPWDALPKPWSFRTYLSLSFIFIFLHIQITTCTLYAFQSNIAYLGLLSLGTTKAKIHSKRCLWILIIYLPIRNCDLGCIRATYGLPSNIYMWISNRNAPCPFLCARS